LEKASQQVLSEVLGYEEGILYFYLLNGNLEDVDSHFSYSKKYRLMKNLFNFGALAKVKSEDKDVYSYQLLPPSFLYIHKISEDIIVSLEKIYLNNHLQSIEGFFSQIILKEDQGLIIFLLKYFMKKDAKIYFSKIDFKRCGLDFNKIDLRKGVDFRRAGLIDKKIVFDFNVVRIKNNVDYIGYISKEDNSLFRRIEDEIKNF